MEVCIHLLVNDPVSPVVMSLYLQIFFYCFNIFNGHLLFILNLHSIDRVVSIIVIKHKFWAVMLIQILDMITSAKEVMWQPAFIHCLVVSELLIADIL